MLSVIIITKNEAQHISRCLASINWADEIIVLGSSTSSFKSVYSSHVASKYHDWRNGSTSDPHNQYLSGWKTV